MSGAVRRQSPNEFAKDTRRDTKHQGVASGNGVHLSAGTFHCSQCSDVQAVYRGSGPGRIAANGNE